MSKYRIIYNGAWYRVQERIFFIFWVTHKGSYSIPREFYSRQDADMYIHKKQESNINRDASWKVINEY